MYLAAVSSVFIIALLVSIDPTAAFAPLEGAKVTSVATGESVDIGEYLSNVEDGGKSMVVMGTYAADFNAVEYAQRLRYYAPELKKRGISKFGLVLNSKADAAGILADAVDLAGAGGEENPVEIDVLVDPLGEAGRVFGVKRGFQPDNGALSPYLKLFVMLWGIGAWATLPAVIGGYIGNPLSPQPWIEDALAVGQKKKRWPDTALELSGDGAVSTNKFKELPVIGGWSRRPLELATLRLQSMLGISLKLWKKLSPDQEALNAGVLTQLGGCVVVNSETGESIYEWRDPGICAVANFENIIATLDGKTDAPSLALEGFTRKIGEVLDNVDETVGNEIAKAEEEGKGMERRWNFNEGQSPFGFKKNAEIWNGRIAQISFMVVLILEAVTGKGAIQGIKDGDFIDLLALALTAISISGVTIFLALQGDDDFVNLEALKKE